MKPRAMTLAEFDGYLAAGTVPSEGPSEHGLRFVRIIWTDDSRVVYQVASKHYGTPERCEIEVECAPAPIVASALEQLEVAA